MQARNAAVYRKRDYLSYQYVYKHAVENINNSFNCFLLSKNILTIAANWFKIYN